MDCKAPSGVGGPAKIQDLCWLDEQLLIAADVGGQQVLKFNFDITGKSCSFRVLDSGFRAIRVHCSSDGKAIVADETNLLMKVYNASGLEKSWKPDSLSAPAQASINIDEIIISTFSGGPFSVYDRKYKYLYHNIINKSQLDSWFTYLTDTGLLLTTTGTSGHYLIIYNTTDHSSATVGGLGGGNGTLHRPSGVAVTSEETILICEQHNRRLSEFSSRGRFLRHISLEGHLENGTPWAASVQPRSGVPSNVALVGGHSSYNRVEIYSFK